MRASDIYPGKAYLVRGGLTYREVDEVVGGRVRWHNDCFTLKTCTVANFASACEREATPAEVANLQSMPPAKEKTMILDKQNLEALLREACANVGEGSPVELPTAVAAEFARLVVHRNQSDLHTAACIIGPPLQMLLAMGAIGGPSNAVADLRRGYDLLAKSL